MDICEKMLAESLLKGTAFLAAAQGGRCELGSPKSSVYIYIYIYTYIYNTKLLFITESLPKRDPSSEQPQKPELRAIAQA